jgi:carnosine synthase
MGASQCKCFDGVKKGVESRFPEASAKSSEEAMQFIAAHPRTGSWQGLDPKDMEWATPVPTRRLSGTISLDDPNGLSSFDGDERAHAKPNTRFEAQLFMTPKKCLPRPMRKEEREKAIRTILPTATHEILGAISPALLESDSLDAQNLRRKLVHGSTVVFFTAGYAGKRFVFERACELGVKSVVIDHPDSWCRSLVDEGVIAKFLPIDMSESPQEVFAKSLEQIKRLGEDGLTGPADAVITFVELSVAMVARLAEHLALPGQTPDAVDTARDKHAARAALKSAGLPTPANCLLHQEADLEGAARLVGFPMVLKPISGAASLGVKKVETRQELTAVYREVVAELSTLVVVSGALVKNASDGKGVQADTVVDMTVLCEQYLDGAEVDVDVVMSDGQWRYAAITENGPTIEPYFQETWAVCPSLIPVDHQRQLKDLAVKSVEACGFTAGVFHVELKYTSNGPQLIEVNARMGGGPVRLVNKMVWGVDFVEETIFIGLGIPARPPVPKEPLTAISYYYVNALKSGTVVELPPLDKLRKTPGVVAMSYFVNEGDKVVGPDDGLPTWLGDVIVQAPSSEKARDLMKKMFDEFPARIGK